MWFWDFAPPSRWGSKYISKKELKKLKDNFKLSDEISKKAREKEQEEQEKASQEIDDLLKEIV
jgi:hypothetical protein